MNAFLVIGIVLFGGFFLGQEMQRARLPKILGYLIAGVIFNPSIAHFVPRDITARTDVIENVAIALIAFSIGGSIVFPEIKKLGKGVLYITIFEAEVTFLAIMLGLLATLPLAIHIPKATWFATFIPVSLILGCLGSPTDPSVALAVTHEYNTKGEVTSTILDVAAFDDVLGIINYSVAIVLARAIISQETFSASQAFLTPAFIIIGSVALGIALGILFNLITKRIASQTEGVFFVLVLSLVTMCWGLATFFGAEEILSIMVMGIVIANYNSNPKKIFQMLERYSEELVFLIFFTLSGMHLDFKLMSTSLVLLIFFIIFRTIGKFAGTLVGAKIARSSPSVKKYTFPGLIPFGGIVIGLALMMHQDPAFEKISGYLVSAVIGATIINEFLGPIFVKKALKGAGEMGAK